MIGETISHYKIQEKLGEGGMGIVYKAEDTTLKRTVALKFLPAHVSSSESDRARFLLEAQAAAALNHPNICTIHGIEEQDGQTFIVMEFVDGQTLREKRAGLTLAKAVDIGVQVAEGLSAAHEKGIVHRDIKPENIMVRKDGLVQVMDFGLAKLRASRASRLTKEGSTIGTAGYMSPEQVQGQETDHRSDIFSLGVLLYELFTGEPPFKGVHETALLYEIVNVDPAPMSSIKPEIDPELDRIVLECLQKEPDERYNSVKDIAKDLKRFKRESSRERASRIMQVNRSAVRPGAAPAGIRQETRVAARPWTGYLWPGIAVAALCGAAFLLYLLLAGRGASSAEVTKFDIVLKEGLRLAWNTFAVDISPDGRSIAVISTDDRRSSRMIRIRRLDDLSERPVPGSEGAADVRFSPDGEWLAFSADGKLKKISTRGGSAIELATVTVTRGIDWGEGDRLVYSPSSGAGLFMVPAAGGDALAITELDSAAGEVSHRGPQLLPGGEAVLFTIKTKFISSFDEGKIAVQRLGSSEKKILIEGGSYGRYIGNGNILYAKGSSLFLAPFDPAALEITGPPQLALDSAGMMNDAFGHYVGAVSAAGTIVYAEGGRLQDDQNLLTSFDRTGAVVPFLDPKGSIGPFSISPDGRRVAAQLYAANDDIWIYDVERQLASRFTFAGGNNWTPRWTPDGKNIVFSIERDGAANLYMRPADGSQGIRRLSTSRTRQQASAISSDGKYLLYEETNEEGNRDLCLLTLDGSEPARPLFNSRFNEAAGAISPDGKWVAFESDEAGSGSEIYVSTFPNGSGKWRISTGGGAFPEWTKGGSEIVYFSSDWDVRSIPVTYDPEFRPGVGRTLFRLPFTAIDAEVSPDGERITVTSFGRPTEIKRLVVVMNWFEEVKRNQARTATN